MASMLHCADAVLVSTFPSPHLYRAMPSTLTTSTTLDLRELPRTYASPLRLLVADERPVMRFGVKHMLQDERDVHVVGEASDGEAAKMQTLQQQPDILLLGVQVPRHGLDVLRAVLDELPSVKVLLLTGKTSAAETLAALETGARGMVQNTSPPHELSLGIHAVAGGDYWIRGQRIRNLAHAVQELTAQAAAAAQKKNFGLTPREIEVVRCILEGCSNRDIAKRFLISEETVKRHLSNIFDKTGVSTRLELALFALSRKLAGTHA